MRFRDRQYGGRLLAEKLEAYRTQRPIVLGLTRGGVLVASEVARALGAVLDVMVVRKLGAPECPEYAVGAIAEGGAVYVNPEAVREVGLSDEELAALAEREASVVARRVLLYRGDRGMADVGGRTAIVVDDGVATGATTRAALRAVRKQQPAELVLAVPVAASDTLRELRGDADAIVCLEDHTRFGAIGAYYHDFRQVSDEEVMDILARFSV